ncbi:C-type lectin lectoxin-Thr1-like isoform X1 [Lasioglossum baleicum]|uniref:C-type lectin lectoxin-Thr1-like isoform X1 n=1 Tax=Lasioglossum baleicum TaxID=434251 RepID=UPI003FCC2F40
MRKSSLTSLASVALVVLFFGGGQTTDVILEASNIHFPNDQSNKSAACPDTVTINGRNVYHAEHQAFFVNAFSNMVFRGPKGYCVTTLERGDYVIRPGIGAHKLFKHKVTWNTAREICMRDGGQLAVIDSADKEAVFRSWMTNETLNGVWLGIHDLFEQGSWVTLTGEPVAAMTYYPWAKDEPNNWHENQHCGILWATLKTQGISDTSCTIKESFICEISLCEDPGPIFPSTRIDML